MMLDGNFENFKNLSPTNAHSGKPNLVASS